MRVLSAYQGQRVGNVIWMQVGVLDECTRRDETDVGLINSEQLPLLAQFSVSSVTAYDEPNRQDQ